MKTFRPPTYTERADTGNRLIDIVIRIQRGYTVLKHADGTYTQLAFPTQDDIANATVAYLGGHEHLISDAEATALTTAGYGSYIT